ncbi:MAG TPA: hypothetical protein VJH22_07220 [Candidatus Nanoarchaeia archaeon]|nr:hypothetical protein [Candidatus Nanoarchaeia archaeon]
MSEEYGLNEEEPRPGNGQRYALNRIANARTMGLPRALLLARGAAEGRAYFRPGSDRLRQLYREGPSPTYTHKTAQPEGLETALVGATNDQTP